MQFSTLKECRALLRLDCMFRRCKMFLFFLLFFLFILQSNAGVLSQVITLSVKKASLEKVFREIRRQTGYTFVYTNELLRNTKPVDLEVQSTSLETVLNLCLKDQPLTYAIVEKVIVLKEKPVEEKKENVSGDKETNEVQGRVTNSGGEPLANASVVIGRTGYGTQTNSNGVFKLRSVNSEDAITVTYTGYKPQSQKIGDRKRILLVMEIADNELDEAVVQAYGTTTRRLTTSNIVKVSATEIERQPVMNPLLALQGKVAGLEVKQVNGYASGPIKVELRGRSAIGNFPSDPLYIIDGTPLTILNVGGNANYQRGSTGFLQTGGGFNGPANGQSPLFNINPSDIESIEVLKDADATAIYGSRGANGVILITTKKGKVGKTIFDFKVQQGVSKFTRYWNMLNAKQYFEMRREALKNDNLNPTTSNAYDLLVWDTTRITDWQKQLYGGTGRNTDVQLSLSGGDARTNFRISGSYNRSTNILTASGADRRASVSVNLSHRSVDEKFNVVLNSIYSYTKSDMANLPGKVNMPPNAPPVFDISGKPNYAGWAPIRGQYPFAGLFQPYTAATNFLNASLSLSYLPVKGLRISCSGGYNYGQANQTYLKPIASQDPLNNPLGSAQFGYNNNKNWIVEPQASYDIVLGKGILSTLVGGSLQQTITQGTMLAADGFTNDALLMTVSNASTQYGTDNYGQYKYAALFSRITYNWANKYILNLNARRDGSSRFGAGSQFGNFGSIGAAWIFTSEKWLGDHVGFLSFGKLRASYGTTGSDAVNDYAYLTRWSSSGLQSYGGVQPISPRQHANPDFQWQVNKKLDATLDLGLFKDRINLSATFYRQRIGNQLISFPTPAYTGFTSVTANSVALVENKGWEFTASANVISNKNIRWSISFNTAFNRNKLIAYPNFSQSPYVGIYVIGKPLNMAYLLNYLGVDPLTGLYTFEDINKDGTISTSGSTDDRYIVKKLAPDFNGGLGTNVNYKRITVSLFFNIVKQTGINAINQGDIPGRAFNQPSDILNSRWQKAGDNAQAAKFTTKPDISYTNFKSYSNAGYTDASFIRLSNVAISYGLPLQVIKRVGLQSCSIFFHANNVFVITKYKGIDPETQNFGGLPPVRNFNGGISMQF
ncbi:MAG: SusC/RagA family TonB-linked outer membrane protein [Chitinophagaceae bacterium]